MKLARFLYGGREPEDLPVMLGCDPEAELLTDRGEVVHARRAIARWRIDDSIGQDGSGGPIEFRPLPGESPERLVENLGGVLRHASRVSHRHRLFLSAAGHKLACGFHIHISWPYHAYVPRASLVRLIDERIGDAVLSVSGRARGSYRERGAWREQSYTARVGIEYRTPGAAWLFCPDAALTLFEACLASAQEEFDPKVSQRLLAWSTWLRAAVEAAPIVPVLWGRAWRSEALVFASEFGLPSPPISARRPAKRVAGYETLLAFLQSPQLEFVDTWGYQTKYIFTKRFERARLKRVKCIRLWGMAMFRGLVWSVPNESCTLPDGQTVVTDPTMTQELAVSDSGTVSIGLPYSLRTGYDAPAIAALADAVARLVERADAEAVAAAAQ
jgi:hypothetical protein